MRDPFFIYLFLFHLLLRLVCLDALFIVLFLLTAVLYQFASASLLLTNVHAGS